MKFAFGVCASFPISLKESRKRSLKLETDLIQIDEFQEREFVREANISNALVIFLIQSVL